MKQLCVLHVSLFYALILESKSLPPLALLLQAVNSTPENGNWAREVELSILVNGVLYD